MDPQMISIAISSRPYREEPVTADAWHLAWHETTCRIALIAGAGQGLATANTAAAAARIMTDAPRLAPARVIARCHDALGGSPGVSILVARIDAPGRRIAVAAVGEIAARVYRDGDCLDLPVNRGAVGGVLDRVDAVDLEIGSDWLLFAHTNGAGNDSGALHAAPAPADAAAAALTLPAAGETVLIARPR